MRDASTIALRGLVAYFEGIDYGLDGCPTKAQWTKIKARIAAAGTDDAMRDPRFVVNLNADPQTYAASIEADATSTPLSCRW